MEYLTERSPDDFFQIMLYHEEGKVTQNIYEIIGYTKTKDNVINHKLFLLLVFFLFSVPFQKLSMSLERKSKKKK